MFKLDNPADLEKAARSIGSFFFKQAEDLEKTFAFHKAMASHHEAMKAAHNVMHSATKAHADGLAADSEHKGHFHKAAAHHQEMAGHHGNAADTCSGEAEKCKTQIDAMKTMASDWGVTKSESPISRLARAAGASGTVPVVVPPTTPTGNIMLDMVNESAAALMAKTLSMMDTDPDCQDAMRQHVMKLLSEAVGNTVVPTVSAVAPPRPGVTVIPRNGQPPVTPAAPVVIDKSKTPAQFKKMFATDDEEQTTERPL